MNKFFWILLSMVASWNFASGQTYNWASITDATKHMAGATLGWEYAGIAGVNYGYKLPFKIPVFAQAALSIPFGKRLVDDMKLNIGLAGRVYQRKRFHSILALNALYKRYDNELVNLQQVGLDVKTLNGLYHAKWFVTTEIGLELGMSTHFKHSEIFRQTIYSEVSDGWYQPVSAGMMNLGIQTGYSFGQSDLTFRIGYLQSITSSVNTLIPYYVTLGYNVKIR